MIDYNPLLRELRTLPELAAWYSQLPEQIAQGLSIARWGDLPAWERSLQTIPSIQANHVELQTDVAISGQITDEQREQLVDALRGLHPWRKGPFQLFDVQLNTEWRSDWKWQRVQPHISPLTDRLVLDVGCGNGYYGLRMAGEGAKRVIGIDPSAKFVYQFYAIKKFLADVPVDVLPLGIEALPAELKAFDTVFSMGVFYHRRSPMDHLKELHGLLRPKGELVLETLVIDGAEGEVLVPPGRYAKMNNVWFLPSPATLVAWLKKCGFTNPRCVDICPTTVEEQRATDWMWFQSLQDFLDPQDHRKTCEGLPAPTRAVFIANS